MSEKGKTKSNAKRIAFLFIPYLSAVIVTVLAAVILFVYITSSGIVQLFVNSAKPDDDLLINGATDIGVYEDATTFPKIGYLDQWATINVDGWERRNIAVFLGDTKESLVYGAGHAFFSEFCGFGGRVVMAAHVTTFFREIEDTKEGTLVHVNTIYGRYVYKVEKKVVFEETDTSLVFPKFDREELIMYTCYPYDNHYMPRTHRVALVCTLVEGKQWRMPKDA